MGVQTTAHPALNVTQPFTVFRVIGRRPSSVYIDGNMAPRPDEPKGAGHRLWDLVYIQHEVGPGDQLQDRGGGIVLVTKDGESHSVQLCPPQARELDTAFTHAARALGADRDRAQALLKDGLVEIGSVRRVKWTQPMVTPKDTFAEDHPLVVSHPAP